MFAAGDHAARFKFKTFGRRRSLRIRMPDTASEVRNKPWNVVFECIEG